LDEHEVARTLAVHEAVCAERWHQANVRLGRIEAVLAAIACACMLAVALGPAHGTIPIAPFVVVRVVRSGPYAR
jgi:hypothetical protein